VGHSTITSEEVAMSSRSDSAGPPLRQFGVGLTIAVLLDATIVRLVLLPAIMRVAGPRIWWLPAWLDARLPAFE
jgi:uncharacterized membrane protein YdfJ with MMPL/SSD domain